jgi:hypothetical protein
MFLTLSDIRQMAVAHAEKKSRRCQQRKTAVARMVWKKRERDELGTSNRSGSAVMVGGRANGGGLDEKKANAALAVGLEGAGGGLDVSICRRNICLAFRTWLPSAGLDCSQPLILKSVYFEPDRPKARGPW